MVDQKKDGPRNPILDVDDALKKQFGMVQAGGLQLWPLLSRRTLARLLADSIESEERKTIPSE